MATRDNIYIRPINEATTASEKESLEYQLLLDDLHA